MGARSRVRRSMSKEMLLSNFVGNCFVSKQLRKLSDTRNQVAYM